MRPQRWPSEPVGLRVNTIKTDPARALKALTPFDAQPPGLLPNALRVAAPAAAERSGAVEAIPQFSKGWFEIQDLGSQVAAAAAGEVKGKQVLDLCAGGGGKTLALAAAMANTGQIYAYDSDARRLTDTIRRGDRAGVRNLQVRTPLNPEPLKDLTARMDVVFIDAPCSGTGSWRRHPDTKWRLTPETLSKRQADQDLVLDDGAGFVKAGGRMIYVAMLGVARGGRGSRHGVPGSSPRVCPPAGHGRRRARQIPYRGWRPAPHPRSSGTDGFYVAVLEKAR